MRISSRRFTERYRGPDPQLAFKIGSEVSRSANGSGSGSLCDKSHFVIVHIPGGIIHDDDVWKFSFPPEILDIWGPAGCVALGGGNYLFFGVSPIN